MTFDVGKMKRVNERTRVQDNPTPRHATADELTFPLGLVLAWVDADE